ncbi:MAG: hypothetical protein RL078_358 [Bacteroidota bacterium]
MKLDLSKFKHWKIGLIGLGLIFCASIILGINGPNAFQKDGIQRQFSALEKKAEVEALQLLSQLKNKQKLKLSSEFYYHIYDGERLFGWRNNQLPVGRYKTATFPANGLVKLKNGWYFSTIKVADGLTCCVSFCLQNTYELQNDFLKAKNPTFWPNDFQIQLTGLPENALRDKQGKLICYLSPQHANHGTSLALLLAPLIFILGLCLILFNFFKIYRGNPWASSILLLALIISRIFLYEVNWPFHLLDSDWFAASFFAYDEWTPNFFEFVINCLYAGFALQFIIELIRKSPYNWLKSVILGLPFLYWYWITHQIGLVLEHSNIPVNFEHLFELRLSSFVFFSLIGFFFYQFQLILLVVLPFQNGKMPPEKRWSYLGLLFIPFFILIYFERSWFNLLPIITILLNWILGKRSEFSWFRLSRQLLMLSLFSFFLSLHFQALVKEKELENKRLFAQQLSLDRNINLELAFSQVAPDILKEKWLLGSFDSLKRQITKVSFEHILNQKFFQGVWDGFEIESDLFDASGKPCFGLDSLRLKKLTDLVKIHGEPSEIEEHIYFMPHEEQGLSYVILLPLTSQKTLVLTLISKRIPEEMGFPRLLISDQAGISNSLEQYSIGKYAEGRLIHQTGGFNFPNTLQAFSKSSLKKQHFELRGFEHTVFLSGAGSAIFISTKQSEGLNLITSFAFIFVFWGGLTIAVNFLTGQGLLLGREWSLSLKIQIAFLVILVISLFLYGLGSSIFIGQQFDAYAQQALKEKLHAVEIELDNQLGQLDTLDAAQLGFQLEAETAKLSSVFNTDLFIYDADGFLIASSRPKLFAFGLVGEHMDAVAMDALIGQKNSYFSHQEQIGNLKYRSAYLPLMNEKRNLLGFINLQLFGQQQAYEQQLEEFLKAAINVFILLLALSVFIALIVSNWLIGPLQMVAKSVRNIEFGKKNQRITYQNKDEIGAIVQSYNEKLLELETAAIKLAKSERESAWRDLAQQIAHEIKNPLTPMKLSIQHLLRNLENGHPQTLEQVQKALPSLVEQIDALAAMANEFAQFAKLPEPQFEPLDLKNLVQSALPLFENKAVIQFDTHGTDFTILADKKMLGQVLNNLINNALQATQETENGAIQIRIESQDKKLALSVKDNGVGISEAAKEKIFTPYFTTKSSGSGIGLNVVRQILEKHNGKIHFESEEGEGSCFFVELPLFSEGS